jgi:hypothetical protein
VAAGVAEVEAEEEEEAASSAEVEAEVSSAEAQAPVTGAGAAWTPEPNSARAATRPAQQARQTLREALWRQAEACAREEAGAAPW